MKTDPDRKTGDDAGKPTVEWVIHVDPRKKLQRTAGLTPRAVHVLEIIEAYCGMKWWAFVGLATIAKHVGCSEMQVSNLLDELEAKGWIKRLGRSLRDPKRRIVLVKRIDERLPVAPKDATWETVEAERMKSKLPGKAARNSQADLGVSASELPSPFGSNSQVHLGVNSQADLGGMSNQENKRAKNDEDDASASGSSSSCSSTPEETPSQAVQDREGRDPAAVADPTATLAPGSPTDDLGPLVTEAERRFKEPMPGKVQAAVRRFGREWVEAAIWGLPHLDDWGSLMGALGNWKREDGLPQKVRDAATQAIQSRKQEAERLAKYGPDEFLTGETSRVFGHTMEQRLKRIEEVNEDRPRWLRVEAKRQAKLAGLLQGDGRSTPDMNTPHASPDAPSAIAPSFPSTPDPAAS